MQFPVTYNEYHNKSTRNQIVYLVRHAEAAHNIVEKQAIQDAIAKGIHEKEAQEKARRAVLNQECLRDAPLSQEGKLQVMRKSRSLTMLNTLGGQKYSPPTVVLVSPLRRALMTATELYSHHRPKFVALEILREKRTGFAADECSSVPILQREFPHVDFSDLLRTDKLQIQKGEDNAAVRARGKRFLEGQFAQMDNVESIAIVTHKGWLRELRKTLNSQALAGTLNVNFDLADWSETLYKNAEVRVAEFGWEDFKLKSIVSKSVDSAISSVMGSAVLRRSERSLDALWTSCEYGEETTVPIHDLCYLDVHKKRMETAKCNPCGTMQRWIASFI